MTRTGLPVRFRLRAGASPALLLLSIIACQDTGAHPLIVSGGTAAFEYEHERVGACVAIVCEVRANKPDQREEIEREVKGALSRAFQLDVDDVVVVKRGQIPRTSSGKVRRSALRAARIEAA